MKESTPATHHDMCLFGCNRRFKSGDTKFFYKLKEQIREVKSSPLFEEEDSWEDWLASG